MSIIMRSALEFHGHNPAPELAYVVIDHHGRHVVTWAEVLQARRERQRNILDRKRACTQWRACKIWVAYFGQNLMGGWHAFLEDWRGDAYRIWIDRDRPSLKAQLMTMFPFADQPWEEWKVKFADAFRRRTQSKRPVGVAYVWFDGSEIRPLESDSKKG